MIPLIVDRALSAQVLAWNPANRVHADLSLIDAVAIDVDPASARRLRGRACPDEVLSVPEARAEPCDRLESAVPTLHADRLWAKGLKGRGVNVAVIDTGVALHKDLKSRLVGFHDLVGGKDKPYDDHGHGTHVAGIVAGDGSDSHGKTTGVAPEAGIVAVKAFDRQGKARTSDVISAIQWTVEHKDELGIRVLNLSAKGKAQISYLHDPLARAAEAAWKKGLVTVVAVGNEGPDVGTIGTPAHSPSVIAVGASDDRGTPDRHDDRIWSGSSRGPTPVDGLARPDLLAPGKDIKAAANFSGGYITKTGTSMAAPMVAGIAGLLLQAFPQATPAQLKSALVDTAEWLKQGGGVNDQGHGLVDAGRAWEQLSASFQSPGLDC